MTKSLIATALMLLPLAGQAATVTCAEVAKAVQTKTLKKSPRTVLHGSDLVVAVSQLKAALVIAEAMGPEQASLTPLGDLVSEYQPVFKTVSIGKKKFQTVNLSLGENPYVYLFETGKSSNTGIVSADGSVMIDGKYCEGTGSDVLN